MQALYPSATEKELADYSDDCAICRDGMSSAKILPCGHIFHLFCIRSWLEHHSSCPTCRRSLVSKTGLGEQESDDSRASSVEDIILGGAPNALTNDSRSASRRGSWTAPSSQSVISSSSTANTSSHGSTMVGQAASSALTSAGSHPPIPTGPSVSRPSHGHQLFAFNSEQQPWLSRLGFPRITVEVVDPARDDDEDPSHARRAQQQQQQQHQQQPNPTRDMYHHSNHSSRSPARRYRTENELTDDEEDEDLRRAIAESLAMSQLAQSLPRSQSQSASSLLSNSSTDGPLSGTGALFEPGLRPSRLSTVSLPSLSEAPVLRGSSQCRRGSVEDLSYSCQRYDGPVVPNRNCPYPCCY